jgi:uncharacterized membrane protein YidH (DUF202 family)
MELLSISSRGGGTGFATLMGVLFVLITLAYILMSIYDWKKKARRMKRFFYPKKNTQAVRSRGWINFSVLKQPLKFNHSK